MHFVSFACHELYNMHPTKKIVLQDICEILARLSVFKQRTTIQVSLIFKIRIEGLL